MEHTNGFVMVRFLLSPFSLLLHFTTACIQSPDEMTSQKAAMFKRSPPQILPCTVSQLLSASQVSNGTFAICHFEINQVSVLGVIRGLAPFVTYIQYSVDDMTGPPLTVKQWVNTKDCAPMTFASPGTYVKVIGSLHLFNGQRSLLAMNIRCIKDMNEITSHMLEVVRAHMELFGKTFDVNMNTTAAGCEVGHPKSNFLNGVSAVQGEMLHVIRRFSVPDIGISFSELRTQLSHLSMRDLRTSLTFLLNEGHIFTTVDEQHFTLAVQQ